MMEVYLVGGAVRDKLLGLQPKERDWVVVGSTPEEMLKKGFIKVGKDFPVFLHPETHEEYALARTERKVGRGYYGFDCYARPDVTLEQDLSRRDLTINAIAETEDGKEKIDPFQGKKDLEARILRHVSPAFSEDPVRILRVARFKAKLGKFIFQIAPETKDLMRSMVEEGEVDALVPERVWQEMQKALQTDYPGFFFEVLKECGALTRLWPELEDDIVELLNVSASLCSDPIILFAVLCCCLGKEKIKNFISRFRVPNEYADLAILVSQYQQDYHHILALNADKLVELLERIDAFRRPERFEKFLLACEIFEKGKQEKADVEKMTLKLRQAFNAAKNINTRAFVSEGFEGLELGERIRKARIEAVSAIDE